MKSAPFRVPGRPRLRRLRVSPRVVPDSGGDQRPEIVLDLPRRTVLSASDSAAVLTSKYTTPFAASIFLRFSASIGAHEFPAQPVRGTGVPISPSTGLPNLPLIPRLPAS